IAETAAALFYRRLFPLDPTLRPLFKGDLEEQGGKLMDMLALAVKALARPEARLPAPAAFGRRHARHGGHDHAHDTVGGGLPWTLEQGLGASFTPEVREAWTTLYRLVADTMRMAGNDMVAKGEPAVA